MKIPVYSSTIRRSEMDAVLTCMVEEKIGPGEMNDKLVKLASEVFQTAGALAFRSPSIALSYALNALNLEKNAGVIVSALAPAWQFIALERMDYTPIIVDVVADDVLLSVETLREAVKSGARAIILHETLGYIPDMEKIIELGVPFIEDISQSAGASYKEKPAGSFGSFSILGLEEKDILTAGGGAVLLAPERRNSIVLKRSYEKAPSTDILPDINASLAFIQLKKMNKNMAIRQEMYESYLQTLMQSKHKSIVQNSDSVNPVYSFPVILSSGFADVKKYASKKHIEIEPAFRNSIIDVFENKQEEFINASSVLLRCVLFPLYPRLGSKNVAEITKVLATLP